MRIRPWLPAGVISRAREKSVHVKSNASWTCSRASDPLLKQVSPMYSPVGEANTWPVPDGSTRGSFISPKIVSLVPSEIATRPSRTRPTPIRLHGLSPDHAMTRAGGSPRRACQYAESVPATLQDGATVGSLSARPGAVAFTAAGHHCLSARSIRFAPEASPGSMDAWPPTSSDARYELTRWTRAVAA